MDQDKTSLNLKIDKSLKNHAQRLADDIGIPLTTVISIQLKDFVRSRSLVMSALPRLNPEIEQEIIESVAQFDARRQVIMRNRRDLVMYLRRLR